MFRTTLRPVTGRIAILLAGVLSMTGGCAGPGREASSTTAGGPSVQRAVDVFGDDSLEGSRDLEALAGVVESVVDESFDDATPSGWLLAAPAGARGEQASLVEVSREAPFAGAGSLAIGVATGPPRVYPQLHRPVAARPSAIYLLQGVVRSENLQPRGRESLGATVEVFEFGEEPGGQPLAYHGHLPRERGTSDGWRRLEYRFRTSPNTRRLVVALVGAVGPATGRAWFDDIRLSRLSDLAGLARSPVYVSSRRPAPDPRLRDVSLGDDTRPCVVTPVGASWEWRVPEGPSVLRLGVAAVSEAALDADVCFEVTANGRKLLEECRAARAVPEGSWTDLSVRLPAPAPGTSSPIALRFESRADGAEAPEALALWGQPRVAPAETGEAVNRPDVVLIVFDTLRRDHLGAEGYTRRPTSPRIDALAARAVRFSRAYAPSPWTTTTVASVLTGLYPARHGAGLRIPREIETSDLVTPPGRMRALGHTGLRPAGAPLAERLQAAGYETVMFHRNDLVGAELGFARGFDRFRYYRGDGLRAAAEGAELARDWLRARRRAGVASPYFLVLHLMDPHLPYRMRQEYYETFGPPWLPPGTEFEASFPFVAFHHWDDRRRLSPDELDRVVAMYDSEIAYADAAAGAVVAEVEADDAVVVVLSDHGEAFGEHGLFEHGNSMYDELLRVPLYVRLPGGAGAGEVVFDPVSLVDVAPTLLALAGAEIPEDLDGCVLPGLPGLESSERPLSGLLAEGTFLGPDRTAVILDGYKHVFTHPQGFLGFQDGTPETRARGRRPAGFELYRLDDDPEETTNLWTREPRVAARLHAAVTDHLERTSHGLHVRCGGAAPRRELSLTASATLGEVKAMNLEPDDSVRIADSRRRVDLSLSGADPDAGADEDWLILRFLDPATGITLDAGESAGCATTIYAGTEPLPTGGRLELGSAEPVGRPAARPPGSDCWCQVWEVPNPADAAGAADPGLDQETLQRLRALGYVHP